MDPGSKALAHAEIMNVLSLYYQALDQGDLETLESRVIAEDATWILVQLCGDERLVDESTGRSEILTWFRRMFGAGVSMTEGTVRHYLNTHVIEVDGEHARDQVERLRARLGRALDRHLARSPPPRGPPSASRRSCPGPTVAVERAATSQAYRRASAGRRGNSWVCSPMKELFAYDVALVFVRRRGGR